MYYYYISTLKITQLLKLQNPDDIQSYLPSPWNLLLLFPALLFTIEFANSKHTVRFAYLILLVICHCPLDVNSVRTEIFICFAHYCIPHIYNRGWHITRGSEIVYWINEWMSECTNTEYSQMQCLTPHQLSWSPDKSPTSCGKEKGRKRLISLSLLPHRDMFLFMSMQLLARLFMEPLIRYRRLQIYVRNTTFGCMWM